MARKHRLDVPTAPAAMVGFAMILLVVLSQGARLLSTPLFSLVFLESSNQVLVAPEWATGAYNLLMSVICFGVPYLFLKGTGRRLGLKLSLSKGRIPLLILLPLFLGLMALSNSVSNLLRTIISSLIKLELSAGVSLPESFVGKLFYMLTVCFSAAIFEELFFRGAVQGLLRSWGPRFAIIVSSLLFTLMHASLWEMPTILILGLMLGYVAEVSRSVKPCIILHGANNLLVFLLLLAREEMETTAAFALILWLMLLFVALFGGAIWAIRSFKLGSKMLIRHDPQNLGSAGKRFSGLFQVPAFLGGMVAVLANLLVTLLGS